MPGKNKVNNSNIKNEEQRMVLYGGNEPERKEEKKAAPQPAMNELVSEEDLNKCFLSFDKIVSHKVDNGKNVGAGDSMMLVNIAAVFRVRLKRYGSDEANELAEKFNKFYKDNLDEANNWMNSGADYKDKSQEDQEKLKKKYSQTLKNNKDSMAFLLSELKELMKKNKDNPTTKKIISQTADWLEADISKVSRKRKEKEDNIDVAEGANKTARSTFAYYLAKYMKVTLNLGLQHKDAAHDFKNMLIRDMFSSIKNTLKSSNMSTDIMSSFPELNEDQIKNFGDTDQQKEIMDYVKTVDSWLAEKINTKETNLFENILKKISREDNNMRRLGSAIDRVDDLKWMAKNNFYDFNARKGAFMHIESVLSRQLNINKSVKEAKSDEDLQEWTDAIKDNIFATRNISTADSISSEIAHTSGTIREIEKFKEIAKLRDKYQGIISINTGRKENRINDYLSSITLISKNEKDYNGSYSENLTLSLQDYFMNLVEHHKGAYSKEDTDKIGAYLEVYQIVSPHEAEVIKKGFGIEKTEVGYTVKGIDSEITDAFSKANTGYDIRRFAEKLNSLNSLKDVKSSGVNKDAMKQLKELSGELRKTVVDADPSNLWFTSKKFSDFRTMAEDFDDKLKRICDDADKGSEIKDEVFDNILREMELVCEAGADYRAYKYGKLGKKNPDSKVAKRLGSAYFADNTLSCMKDIVHDWKLKNNLQLNGEKTTLGIYQTNIVRNELFTEDSLARLVYISMIKNRLESNTLEQSVGKCLNSDFINREVKQIKYSKAFKNVLKNLPDGVKENSRYVVNPQTPKKILDSYINEFNTIKAQETRKKNTEPKKDPTASKAY